MGNIYIVCIVQNEYYDNFVLKQIWIGYIPQYELYMIENIKEYT